MLELAVARALYEGHPEFSEGQMTKIRAHVVSRASCARVARLLALEQPLLQRGLELGGEDAEALAANDKILAAVLEAALGALFLEHGFSELEGPIVGAFAGEIDFALTSSFDAKTELQEELARAGRRAAYAVLETEGPAHDRRFTCAVLVDGVELGVGRGRSKKQAEQEAAQQALARIAAETSA